MQNIFFSYLYLLLCFLPGFAILSHKIFKKLNFKEKFIFSFAFGIFIYAVFAVLSFAILPSHQVFNVLVLVLINGFSIFAILRKQEDLKAWFDFKTRIKVFKKTGIRPGIAGIKTKITASWKKINEKPLLVLVIAYLIFLAFIHLFISLPFKLEDQLPDGAYVFKEHTLNVKLQALNRNLPADNYIPYAFSQFLEKGISFEKNRPMLPGQEVSNRTILMGLDAAFFLAIISPVEKEPSQMISEYEYLGVTWPDASSLNSDQEYQYFLDLSLVLNSLFLFAVFLLVGRAFNENRALGAVLLLMTLPYTINQATFAWPKFLMAYFLILAAYLALFKPRNYLLMAFFLGLAYHSHPAALVYIGAIGLYWMITNFSKDNLKLYALRLVKLGGLLGLIILPWFIWTGLVIKIPSDLVAQNIATKDKDLLALITVRLENLKISFIPWLMNPDSFRLKLTKETLFSIPGTLGALLLFAYLYGIYYLKKLPKKIFILLLLPLLLLLIPWANPMYSQAVLYGQPFIAVVYALILAKLAGHRYLVVFFALVQSVLSLYVLWLGMYDFPVQVNNYDLPEALFVTAWSVQLLFILGGCYFLFYNRRGKAIFPGDSKE